VACSVVVAARDPLYRVSMVVATAMDNRHFGTWRRRLVRLPVGAGASWQVMARPESDRIALGETLNADSE
jgi:hypothetical protein